jgi:hypothetical protein
MKILAKLFLILLAISIILCILYANTGNAFAEQTTTQQNSVECRQDCDGYCPKDTRLNCGGQCLPERMETCSWHT